MTPMSARIALQNAVEGAVDGVEGVVPVLGADDEREAEAGTAWVRVDVVHTAEEPDRFASGTVQQQVVLTATVYSLHGETTRGDTIAEAIRAALANTEPEGLDIEDGRFADLTEDDEEAIDNYRGLRVSFIAYYDQES